MDQEKLQRFAALLRDSRRAVFFGGAGVSTESGVKDYRSEDGLYNTVRQYGVSPETILSHSFFLQSPEVFYDFYYNYFLNGSAEPNRAHRALAELETRGILSAVITQNIDGLHQKAGSRNVIELHGTTRTNHCTRCGAEAGADVLRAFGGKPAKCEKCGGLLKPDVVLYEESLNEDTIDSAVDAIINADLLIIGGTSLAVYPAAGFIRYFRGEDIVLINRGETAYDDEADLVFRDSIGEVLDGAVRLL